MLVTGDHEVAKQLMRAVLLESPDRKTAWVPAETQAQVRSGAEKGLVQ